MREATGVRPTPRAIEMLDDVTAAIAALSRAVDPGTLDPASINRAFRIAALDFGVTMTAPKLIDVIAGKAPGIQLSFVTAPIKDVLHGLANGQIDLAVGVFEDTPPGFQRRVLSVENYVTVARNNHPALRRGLTLRRYVELNHVLVSPAGELRGRSTGHCRR